MFIFVPNIYSIRKTILYALYFHEEHVAVSKSKVDPKHLFIYAIRYGISKQGVDPLFTPQNNILIDNKYAQDCCVLVNQFNSAFTKPKQTSVSKDPVTVFFHM